MLWARTLIGQIFVWVDFIGSVRHLPSTSLKNLPEFLTSFFRALASLFHIHLQYNTILLLQLLLPQQLLQILRLRTHLQTLLHNFLILLVSLQVLHMVLHRQLLLWSSFFSFFSFSFFSYQGSTDLTNPKPGSNTPIKPIGTGLRFVDPCAFLFGFTSEGSTSGSSL